MRRLHGSRRRSTCTQLHARSTRSIETSPHDLGRFGERRRLKPGTKRVISFQCQPMWVLPLRHRYRGPRSFSNERTPDARRYCHRVRRTSLSMWRSSSCHPRARATRNMSNLPGSLIRTPELDRWIAIENDGSITVSTGKVELGQGILTAIQLIAAEELTTAVPHSR